LRRAAHTVGLDGIQLLIYLPLRRGVGHGPGRWQKSLIRAVSGTVVVSVSGVVKTTVVSPVRDDFTSARRAAKQLALAGDVSALYCHTCARCYEIQDTGILSGAAVPSAACWPLSGLSDGS
jgi:hypothetical protein